MERSEPISDHQGADAVERNEWTTILLEEIGGRRIVHPSPAG